MPPREAPTVEDAATAIETMEVRGAAKIARHAASALGGLAHRDASAGELREAADRLLATRPTAVSLRNAIEYVMGGLDDEGSSETVYARAERFVHDALRARERVGRVGGRLLQGASTVLTHCNSQAAITAIEARHATEPLDAAIVLETRPWRQGLITARQLAEAGVPVRFMVDAAMATALEEVDAVITGCDTIAANGDIVNKIGTALLSLAAQEAGVPFYVAAESFKIDPRSATGHEVPIEEREDTEVLEEPIPGVEVDNPVFDVTPADRIDQIALETGPTPPNQALSVFESIWGTKTA